ncbi:VanZ family protein [Kutzneria chonburiensis]|uniref:VanZ family protein n=1 Tax=Kutzneria chonburiensis TaxID=1483604 RepID=A0ABV6N2I4_9PSEU|nr:VanZ family protein [Kutzneria chonburiensis]
MRTLYRDGFDYFLSKPDVTAALLVGGLVLGALALVAAHLFRWNKPASALAGVSLALALSVTLVRPYWGDVRLGDPLRMCVPGHFSVTAGEALLNFVMLMPLGFFGVLATKRPLLVAMGCVSVSAGIEITQAMFELGVCDGQDFMNNSVGGVLATLAGWLLLLAVGRNRRRQQPPPPPSRPGYGPTRSGWLVQADRETVPLARHEQDTVAIGAWRRP